METADPIAAKKAMPYKESFVWFPRKLMKRQAFFYFLAGIFFMHLDSKADQPMNPDNRSSYGYVIFKSHDYLPDRLRQIFRFDTFEQHLAGGNPKKGYTQFNNYSGSIQLKPEQIVSLINPDCVCLKNLQTSDQVNIYKNAQIAIATNIDINGTINDALIPVLVNMEYNLGRYSNGERLVNGVWLSEKQCKETEEAFLKTESLSSSLKKHRESQHYLTNFKKSKKMLLIAIILGCLIAAILILFFIRPPRPTLLPAFVEDDSSSQWGKRYEEGFIWNNYREEYYARVLGLEKQETLEDIKKRYRELVTQYHPDKVNHLGTKLKRVAEEEMKRINEAYHYFKQSNEDKGA
jgi:hypothetical protein